MKCIKIVFHCNRVAQTNNEETLVWIEEYLSFLFPIVQTDISWSNKYSWVLNKEKKKKKLVSLSYLLTKSIKQKID